MGELFPIFLVAGGFIGTLGLIAWLTRKNKPSGEDSDGGTMSSFGTINDSDSSTSTDSGSGSSDSGSSSDSSSSSC
jgi:hypothetical protein